MSWAYALKHHGRSECRHCGTLNPKGTPCRCMKPNESAQLAELRRALRAYDLAGPLTENRRQALSEVLTPARQLTEE